MNRFAMIAPTLQRGSVVGDALASCMPQQARNRNCRRLLLGLDRFRFLPGRDSAPTLNAGAYKAAFPRWSVGTINDHDLMLFTFYEVRL